MIAELVFRFRISLKTYGELMEEDVPKARAIDATMKALRRRLDPTDAAPYLDAGVMLSRMLLCARMVVAADGEARVWEIYQREVARLAGSMRRTFLDQASANIADRIPNEHAARYLRLFTETLADPGVGSVAWCQAAIAKLDKFFWAIGATVHPLE